MLFRSMKVTLKTIMCGPNVNKKPGEVVDLPDDQAQRLVNTGQAEAVEEAVAAPAEEAKARSEERRVGKECRSRWWRDH